MKRRGVALGALAVGFSVGVAACSTTPSAQPTTTGGAPATTAHAGATTSAPSTTMRSATAANLPVTDALRTQLVAAGAALNNIAASEYTGLAPGLTYYALDTTTGTYWAAARLVPAPSANPSDPTRAQVASQDAGSYYLFEQPRGGGWTAYPDGNSGPATPCPMPVPPGVLQVWGWAAGNCRPANV